MPTVRIEYETEAERLEIERALAFLSDMRRVAKESSDSEVIDALEQTALSQGRDLLITSFAAAVRQRSQEMDQKGLGPFVRMWPGASAERTMPKVLADGDRSCQTRAGLSLL